tara:strand:+ start:23023 stop:23262 length:240 start_codon:yes stop_codon:yes gene_type:complete
LGFLNFFGTKYVSSRYKAIVYFGLFLIIFSITKDPNIKNSSSEIVYFFIAVSLLGFGGLYTYLFKHQSENPEDLNDFDD